jgi:hypothetical protein
VQSVPPPEVKVTVPVAAFASPAALRVMEFPCVVLVGLAEAVMEVVALTTVKLVVAVAPL